MGERSENSHFFYKASNSQKQIDLCCFAPRCNIYHQIGKQQKLNLRFHQRCSDFRRMQGHHSRLLKELPELPWVRPFVKASGFLLFSVPLTLTPGASSSLFARGHRLVTRPRLAAFLNGYDLQLSLASLLYISPNRLKTKNTTKNTLVYAGLLTKKTPVTFCSMKETLTVPGLRNPERGRWWGGVVEGSGDSAQGPG